MTESMAIAPPAFLMPIMTFAPFPGPRTDLLRFKARLMRRSPAANSSLTGQLPELHIHVILQNLFPTLIKLRPISLLPIMAVPYLKMSIT